eukprot:scaffold1926_cov122-Isochrysis_galbana.AAC.5
MLRSHLGRHPVRRADHCALYPPARIQRRTHAKVGYLDNSGSGEEHVGSFHIPMHSPSLLHVGTHCAQLSFRHAAADELAHALERSALAQLHQHPDLCGQVTAEMDHCTSSLHQRVVICWLRLRRLPVA